ncbi:MAG: hypothetical protein WDO73_24115 [Ignavibacteriota bacterium]
MEVAIYAVEFQGDAAAQVGCRDVEHAAVPADAGRGKSAPDGVEAVVLEGRIILEGQLDGPIVRQIELAPPAIVEVLFRHINLGVAGFGEGVAAASPAKILRGIAGVAQMESPAEIEQEPFAGGRRGRSGLRGGGALFGDNGGRGEGCS